MTDGDGNIDDAFDANFRLNAGLPNDFGEGAAISATVDGDVEKNNSKPSFYCYDFFSGRSSQPQMHIMWVTAKHRYFLQDTMEEGQSCKMHALHQTQTAK